MTTKIDKKIVGYSVVEPREEAPAPAPAPVVSPQFALKVERPKRLSGATYKIKSPLAPHALYVTINDYRHSDGKLRPFEIFINSKNAEHFQWTVALTRVLSAVFRTAHDCQFIVDELKSVFDPNGGYYAEGGKFVTSLISEIACVVEDHIAGYAADDAVLDEVVRAVDATNEALKEMDAQRYTLTLTPVDEKYSQCPVCFAHKLVVLDGCATCLECGHSKCG